MFKRNIDVVPEKLVDKNGRNQWMADRRQQRGWELEWNIYACLTFPTLPSFQLLSEGALSPAIWSPRVSGEPWVHRTAHSQPRHTHVMLLGSYAFLLAWKVLSFLYLHILQVPVSPKSCVSQGCCSDHMGLNSLGPNIQLLECIQGMKPGNLFSECPNRF